MPLDLGVMIGTSVAIIAFLVGLPIGLFFTTNLSERYEVKVRKVIIGILGALEKPLDDSRELPGIADNTTDQTELPEMKMGLFQNQQLCQMRG